jgi:hypothetical protein
MARQIVNSRVHGNVLIVDRLFGAAELRLGAVPGRRWCASCACARGPAAPVTTASEDRS